MMIKVISLLLYLFLAPFAGALLDGVDRKITARMQGRKGPKLLQPFYDLIKLFSKQMIGPFWPSPAASCSLGQIS